MLSVLCVINIYCVLYFIFHFFLLTYNATAEIYTLSLHDALPISELHAHALANLCVLEERNIPTLQSRTATLGYFALDRKSTRLHSSHEWISYAAICLKKKKYINKVKKIAGITQHN